MKKSFLFRNNSNASSIRAFVDQAPPFAMEFPCSVKNGVVVNTGTSSRTFTNENSTGPETSIPGHVTLNFKPAIDQGAYNTSASDTTASGIAGYMIYKQTDAGDVLIRSMLVEDTADAIISCALLLSEGEHILRIASFDHIAYAEADEIIGNIPMTKLGPKGPASAIVVDRSGPAAVTLALSGTQIINGRNFVKSGSQAGWDTPIDLPLNSESGSIGIGPGDYIIRIADAKTGLVQTEERITNTGYEFPGSLLDGEYTVFVQALDRLGNPGDPGDAVVFCVDSTPPALPDPASFVIIEDTDAEKTASAVSITFRTRLKNCTVSFAPSSDGDAVFASGVRYYTLRDVKTGAVTILPGAGFLLSGLAPGENIFEVSAVDNAGNQSAAVRLVITRPVIQPVTFPSPCYLSENGIYYLRWNPPHNAVNAIAYYKVMIISKGTPPPASADDFINAPAVYETRCVLANIEQGADLAAYVLAVDSEGAYSIGCREFRLPVSGGEEAVTLAEDEWWGPGVYELNYPVIVPAGITLHICDNTEVRVFGNSGVYIRVDGALDCTGTDPGIVFESGRPNPGTCAWKGIIVQGRAEIGNTIIRNAGQGLAALPGSVCVSAGCAFASCRIGIHAGERLLITGTRFESCEWYGVKEDGITEDTRPVLIDCVFRNNGCNYYHTILLLIDRETLNSLGLNSGNRIEE